MNTAAMNSSLIMSNTDKKGAVMTDTTDKASGALRQAMNRSDEIAKLAASFKLPPLPASYRNLPKDIRWAVETLTRHYGMTCAIRMHYLMRDRNAP